MRTERRVVMGAGMLAIATASMAFAQSAAASGAQVLLSSGGPASFQGQAPEEVVREIDDPHTGDRWLPVSYTHLDVYKRQLPSR